MSSRAQLSSASDDVTEPCLARELAQWLKRIEGFLRQAAEPGARPHKHISLQICTPQARAKLFFPTCLRMWQKKKTKTPSPLSPKVRSAVCVHALGGKMDATYHIGEDGAMGATAEKLLRDIVRFHRHTHTAPPSPQDAAVLLAKLALKRADDEGEGGAASAKEESVDRARRGVARAEARRDRAAQAQEHSSFLKMHDDQWGQGPRLWAQHVQRRVLQVYARHEKKDAELCAKDLNALCKLPVGFIGHECRKMVARKLLRQSHLRRSNH